MEPITTTPLIQFAIGFIVGAIWFSIGYVAGWKMHKRTVNRVDRREPDNEMNSGRY